MQAHLKYHIILLLLITGICHGLAQDFTTYTVSNGLAHQQVKALYQDSKGYLWVGTWDGLTRFDGHSFITYRHSPDDSTSIFSDEVYCITEDSTHALWVVTEKGLAKFNALENNFRRVYLRKSHKIKFNDAGRTCLAFDKYKRGWLLDREGLVGFDVKLTDIQYYDVSSFFNKYGLIIADSTGLWMAGSQGLFHFTFEVLRHEQKLNVGLADQIYRYSDSTIISPRGHNMTRSSDGAFIINIDNKHVFVTNIGSGELVKISNSFNGDERIFEAFGDVYEMSPGKIGLCTENNGLAILDLKTRSFGFGHPLQRIVGKQRVNAIFRDRQNNYWVGTQNELIKYTIPQLDFDAWLYEDGSENSLSGPFVSSLFLDSSKQLWAACKGGGLDCIDLQANSIKNVRIDEIAEMGGDLKTVRYIYGPDDETLLMALDSSLYIWNKKTGSTRFLFKFPGYIYRVFKDQQKKLWIAGSPHILIVSYIEGEVIIVDTLRTGTHCRDICETRKKEMFFATHYGLMKLDSAAPGFLKTYLPPGSEMDPEVFCIHENRDGTLWVGSIRSGIYLFDPQEEIFVKHLSSDNGLMDNSVNGFLQDDHGFLWLSTWKGIVRFDPIEEKFENFGKINGLPVWDFTTGAYLQDDEGNIYFGGMGGVIRFHPDSLVRFMPEYDLQIVGVNANNHRLVLDYPIGDDDMLTLDYDQRDFSMDFSSFDFRHPAQRIYRYKLNGIDKEWRNVKNNDFATRFSGIAPGLYAFELQSSYRGQPWIGEQSHVLIRVKPAPVLQRKSFQTGILLALGISLLSIVLLRMRNASIRKEMMIARLEKESNLSRLNYLKSQMNPHFYFNTLNAINNYVLKSDARSANKYLTSFARLMRDILDNSQKEFVTIAEEKKILENYLTLQQLRFTHTFDYKIHCEDQMKGKSIPPMLIQPFVENAIEYAFVDMPVKGFVTVKFEQQNQSVLVTINDNGIGIEKSLVLRAGRKRTSAAIKNIRQRIEMLNSVYKFSISLSISPCDPANENFPGTSVKLLFPEILSL